MRDIYLIDSLGFFTGTVQQIEEGEPVGTDAVLIAPPSNTGQGSKIARWVGYWEYQTRLPDDHYTPIKRTIPITVTGVTGAINASNLNDITVTELVDITVTADVPIGFDVSFRIPMLREDTGRVIYKIASIENNVMTATFSLPTSGKWVTSESLINSDIAEYPFTFEFTGIKMVAV